MWLRAPRQPHGPVAVIVHDENQADTSMTSLHPYWVTADLGAQLVISQRVPHCQWSYWPYEDTTGAGTLWLLDFISGSWANLTHITATAEDDEFRVDQHGPRRLWDEVKPTPDHWRFTVTAQEQQIELLLD